MGEGVLFFNNSAVYGGGAMGIINPEGLDIRGVTFQSNTAEYGGAVSVASTSGSSREFDGCLFEDNVATDGGALYVYTSAGKETVRNSVFTGNYASERLGYILGWATEKRFAGESTGSSHKYFGS